MENHGSRGSFPQQITDFNMMLQTITFLVTAGMRNSSVKMS